MMHRQNARRMDFWCRAAVFILVCLAPGVCCAQSTSHTEELLGRVRAHVEEFVQQFSAVKCTEQVVQMKLGRNGKVDHKEESVFDYLVLVQAVDDDLTINESRLLQSPDPQNRPASLLVTNGFSTLLMIFHPFYRPSFEYQALADERFEGKQMHHLVFRHLHGTPSPTVLLLRGREFPLDLTGEAWIDPESGTVVRILVDLESPLDDLGLLAFRSEVRYEPVRFTGLSDPYWLPAKATIDVRTARQHWRNVHRFNAYQRFGVDTRVSIGEPQ